MAITMVKTPRSSEVMNAWLGTLRALVPLVPQQVCFSALIPHILVVVGSTVIQL